MLIASIATPLNWTSYQVPFALLQPRPGCRSQPQRRAGNRFTISLFGRGSRAPVAALSLSGERGTVSQFPFSGAAMLCFDSRAALHNWLTTATQFVNQSLQSAQRIVECRTLFKVHLFIREGAACL